MVISRPGAVLILMLSCLAAGADSLWAPGFQGYLSGSDALREGDIVFVEVDAANSLTLSVSGSDAKSAALSFSGGEFGDLLSFLPSVSASGDQAGRTREAYALKSVIGARVVAIDAAGRAQVQGTRSTALGGKEESLTVSGWVDGRALGAQKKVKFSQLADSRLLFRSYLQAPTDTLALKDLVEVAQEEGAAPATGVGPAVPLAAGPVAEKAAVPPAGPTAVAAEAKKSLRLSEAKRKELLLRYINRLIDFLFQ